MPANTTPATLPPGPGPAFDAPPRRAAPPRVAGSVGTLELLQRVERGLADARRQGQRLSLLAVQVQRLGVAQASGLRGLAVPVDGLRPPPPQVEAAVLDACMQRLSGRVRQSDLPLRLDERRALVLLPGAGDQEAAVVATRLERLLVGTYGHEPWRVELTVSVGRASYPECGVTARDLVRAAQRGLEGVAAERS
ncbi:diguanylate cyclase domain-containing protein [Piscinibacter sakaiensis]|uniref:GGDEF domain-containing protein n=1 Tax=Piscinibacter sakaiensis TaxID=1547922 RepID=A0A0K8P1M0_PISS1|nr:diguanylate cyclase [Piscinibacter sakaiensis]GAP36518.1 hypothetical protein ISF6_2358 [Piscinibacter sakaiensis]